MPNYGVNESVPSAKTLIKKNKRRQVEIVLLKRWENTGLVGRCEKHQGFPQLGI